MTAVNPKQATNGVASTNNRLPEGWKTVALADVGMITTGNTPPKKDPSNFGAAFPWVKPSDLEQLAPITGTQEYLSERGAKKARLLPAHTTMVSCIGNLGKVGFAGTALATNQQINSVTFHDGLVDGRYGFFYCKTLKGWLEDHASATTLSIINKHRFCEAPFLLPPLAEQKRIVTKVEQLLARVNAAREHLAKVPAILKRFRQSVLAAACSGKLTADWRDENSNYEAAARLIERIFTKREEQFEVKSKTTKVGGRKIPKKLAGLRPRKVEVEELPEIPERWAWVYLPDLGYMSRGKSRHRPRNAPHLYGGPYPFIQTGDIAQSGGRITSHQQTYSEEGLAQSRLWPSDTVCITIAANIASSAILTYPACFPDSVVGVNPDVNLCLAEYLEFFIRTAQTDLDQFAPATAQKNINIAILNDVVVPLPPFAEQEEIVRRVESLFKLAATIEKQVAVATAQAEKLTQSILARAFKGELVSTEAELARWEGRDYEPASVLLERIKAEREAMEKEKPIKKQAVSRGRRYRKPAKATATESECAVTADTSEGAKRISTKPDLSSHGTAIPPVSNRGTPAIQQKAASITAKKHRRETFQHAVPLSDLQTDEVMAAFRKACRGRGAMSREE